MMMMMTGGSVEVLGMMKSEKIVNEEKTIEGGVVVGLRPNQTRKGI